MKKRSFFCLLMATFSIPLSAQCIVYPNLKGLLAQEGDTIATVCVEKRSRNQIMLTGGADYRVTTEHNESLSRRLKKRTFAVRTNQGDLYLNCRKLRYKKMRFGGWYAPAVLVGGNLYFCAVPLGSVIGGQFVPNDEVKLGGKVGDAIATSSLVNKRVCYELDSSTGKVEFLSKEKMLRLLDNHPDEKAQYLREENPDEAQYSFKYLQNIKDK
ncbi:MAG: hypothetical protein LBN24_09790 [Mediterranea sp.]|jgi:hypothetical protein|nr:hypothetical protein [Mediterranea sp.]